jgi:hypothetical protein
MRPLAERQKKLKRSEKMFRLDNLRFLKSKKDTYAYRVYLPALESYRLKPMHLEPVLFGVRVLVIPVSNMVCWGFETGATRDAFIHHKPRGWAQEIKSYLVDGTVIEDAIK